VGQGVVLAPLGGDPAEVAARVLPLSIVAHVAGCYGDGVSVGYLCLLRKLKAKSNGVVGVELRRTKRRAACKVYEYVLAILLGMCDLVGEKEREGKMVGMTFI